MNNSFFLETNKPDLAQKVYYWLLYGPLRSGTSLSEYLLPSPNQQFSSDIMARAS
jgi:hypothetical protein